MKKKDRGLPEVVFLGPPQRRIGHRLVVFRILQKDESGIPTLCMMMKDKDTVNIEGGEEFMTGYVQEVMFKPQRGDGRGCRSADR
jgi:hypothetical protein